MRFKVQKETLKVLQSSIDVALWVLVPDDDENFDHNRKTFGCVLTYVDGFRIVAPKDVRNAIEGRFRGPGQSKLLEI